MSFAVKKKTLTKVVAVLMCVLLAIPAVVFNTDRVDAATTARYEEEYEDAYNISTILSGFQFFIENDVTLGNGGHTVGSIAVGGTVNMANSFGDAAVVPSYIFNHESGNLGTGWHGKYPDKIETVYYGTSSDAGLDPSKWIQNPDYMSMSKAFAEISAQSEGLMDGAAKINAENGVFTVDCTSDKDVNVVLDISSAPTDWQGRKYFNVNIIVENVDWFRDNLCVISLTGIDDADAIFDGYSSVQINGTGISNQLKNMTGSDREYGSQLNVLGMNLLWNFPDATGNFDIQGLGGHFVAPRASVNFASGNYEGGVIAKNMSGDAEGHFYPMTASLRKGSNTPTPTSTPKPTNTPKPTSTPTKAPTSTPTKAPTSTPTKAPTSTPTKAPTSTPTKAPTSTPTKAPTKVPTKAPTKVPTKAPTKVPTKAPTKVPTSTPTKAPTSTPTKVPTSTPTSTPKPTNTNTPTPTNTPKPTNTPTPTLVPDTNPATVRFAKVDTATYALLPGSTITLTYTGSSNLSNVVRNSGPEIYKSRNNKSLYWTSTDEPLELGGLPDGKYNMSEVSAPVGYQYSESVLFEVKGGKVYDTKGNEIVSRELIMEDDARVGSITLTGTKEVIGDAPSETYNFVVKEGDTIVATGSVTEAGTIEFTPIEYSGPNDIGTHIYSVSETAGDTNGMTYDDTVFTVVVEVADFELDEDGDHLYVDEFVVTVVESESEAIVFTNTYTAEITPEPTETPEPTITPTSKPTETPTPEPTEAPTPTPKTGDLIIVVQDEKTGERVEDAVVEVTDPDGNKTTHVTDKDGKITLEGLEEGVYDIVTKEVPDGYDVTVGEKTSAEVIAGEVAEHVIMIATAGEMDEIIPPQTGDDMSAVKMTFFILMATGAVITAAYSRKKLSQTKIK